MRFPRSPCPSRPPKRARLADLRHTLRLNHLDQAIRRWLGSDAASGAAASAVERLLGTTVSRWLDSIDDGPVFERLPTLVAELQAQLPAAQIRTAAEFDAAFAGLLVEQAFGEVAREAGRSGRAVVFVCLKPYFQENPSAPELVQLAQMLAVSPEAIELALGSMRRRLRGRVAAALDLWASTPDSRDTLRRHMRAALKETTP